MTVTDAWTRLLAPRCSEPLTLWGKPLDCQLEEHHRSPCHWRASTPDPERDRPAEASTTRTPDSGNQPDPAPPTAPCPTCTEERSST